MTKRTLLFVLLCCVSTVGALGQTQTQPWNCNVPTNKNLICLLPVATFSTATNTQNSPASAFNSAFATQLSNLPIVSSASGIGVTFDSAGHPLTSENLGPILSDRAETIGRHKLFVGFFYQRFRFNSIDGTSLNNVPFVITSGPTSTQITQYVQQRNDIDFKLDQYVGIVTFGLTTKTDISVVIPIDRVSIGVSTQGNEYFFPSGQVLPISQYVSGTFSGIGDVIANVKNTFTNGEHFKFAGGMLLRFPSGNALNYTGSGAFGFNPYTVVSYQWKVSPHARLGYLWNTSSVLIPNTAAPVNGMSPPPTGGSSQLPGGFQYDIGADWAALKKLTVAGDFMGNQFLNSPSLVQGTQTIPETPYDANADGKDPYAGKEFSTRSTISVSVQSTGL